MSGTKLSPHTRNGSIWRTFCMQGEFCTVLTTKKPSRENFVPNARQRSSEPTQQHTRPHRCEVRRIIQRARAGFEARGIVQTNFAHNFPRSLFKTLRKRCNSNDTNSISKQVAGELRAKLLGPSNTSAQPAPQVWRAPEHPEGLAAVPVGGGGAWPGFETTRRAKLAARTARGRAAAHRHTQRPGPPAPGTPVGLQATTTRVRQRGGYRSTRPSLSHCLVEAQAE